jgi:hypothetical protein
LIRAHQKAAGGAIRGFRHWKEVEKRLMLAILGWLDREAELRRTLLADVVTFPDTRGIGQRRKGEYAEERNDGAKGRHPLRISQMMYAGNTAQTKTAA